MGMVVTSEVTLPLRRGEIPAKILGTAIETVDEEGNSIIGKVGHVVLSKPFPGLFMGILGDEDGSATKAKYFSKFPGKVNLGDFAIINPKTKGWYICGRSDSTLKQRGCRFGSSEIYEIVDKFPEVRDAVCVSKYNKAMDESAVLFIKVNPGNTFDEELVTKIRKTVADQLTPQHVPDFILETKDIPYNVNGKKMESLVKNIINHKTFKVSDIVNPDSCENFLYRPEFQNF